MVFAAAAAAAPAKEASLVIDAESGRVLHAVNADTHNYPASLTKMMTLLLVFEALDDGRLSLSQALPVSQRAAQQPPSKVGLAAGRTITVKDAIYALVTKSANDVAVAVAEALAGSERDFALAMTAKARKLGMAQTTFRNASGLPHTGQMSTARDMATLARALITLYPRYYRFFSTEQYTLAGTTYKNHNQLLGSYDGVDGIKTGYIRASGFNLVVSAKRDESRLIGVVFGGRSPTARDRLMERLLDKAFASLNAGDPVLAEAADDGGEQTVAALPVAAIPVVAVSTGESAEAAPRGTWGIQVGAYVAPEPARSVARKVLAKLPKLLSDGAIAVVPLERRKRKPVYRAQILGIDKSEAYQACRVLKRHKMDCMELRMRPDDLASSAS